MDQNSGRIRSNAILGMVLIGVGALIWLGQIFHISGIQMWLPFIFILPGMMFFVGMVLGGRQAAPLAVPGSIVTMAGLILLVQAFLGGYYRSWAYAWSLIFPTAVGIGLLLHGRFSGDPAVARRARGWLVSGLILFLVAGAFFELMIFSGGAGRMIWPGMMVVLGIYLLFRQSRSQSATANAGADARPVEAKPVQTAARPIPRPPAPPAAPEFEPLDRARSSRKSRPPKDNQPQV